MPGLGIRFSGLGNSPCYLLSINAYTQRSGDYYFELGSEGSLEGFKLSYKDKSVAVQYIIDENGKIAFSDNNKLNCVSYTDGSYMSNFIKYKILNYFCRWLSDNDLLSDKITVTFH